MHRPISLRECTARWVRTRDQNHTRVEWDLREADAPLLFPWKWPLRLDHFTLLHIVIKCLQFYYIVIVTCLSHFTKSSLHRRVRVVGILRRRFAMKRGETRNGRFTDNFKFTMSRLLKHHYAPYEPHRKHCSLSSHSALHPRRTRKTPSELPRRDHHRDQSPSSSRWVFPSPSHVI